MSGGLPELAAAILSVTAQIEGAQSSADATMEQMSEALRQLGQVSDGSSNLLVSDACADLIASISAIEEVLGMQVRATERLRTYLAARGL